MKQTGRRNRSGLERRAFLKGAVLGGIGLTATGSVRAAEEKPPGEEPPAERVPRRQLGTTGQEIPVLLMGCAQAFDPRYDRLLHRAFDSGVDYLDTALTYGFGQSHKTIAPFLTQVGRDKVWITSKSPHAFNQATVETFTRNLDLCLQQLGTDHLDMFFMHELSDPKYLEKEFIQMGEAMRKSKKTRFFGFSCHDGNVAELLEKAATVGGIDAIMFAYNFSRYGDKELNLAIDHCKKAGIGLIAMKTQASIPDEQEKVVEFASSDFTLPQAKLKSVWADDRIDAAVSHMDNLDKLRENVAAAQSGKQLSMREQHQLNRLAARTAAWRCQGCSHLCEPKVAGDVRIAEPLRYLMYAESYGEVDKARRLYGSIPAHARSYEGLDLRAATEACPQGIPIAQRLSQAQKNLA